MGLDIVVILAIFFAFVIGAVFGGMAAFIFRRVMFNRQIRIAERKAAKMIAEARDESRVVLNDAQEEARKAKASVDAEYRERRSELQRQENRLIQKIENLDRKLESVEQRERGMAGKEKEIESIRGQLGEVRDRQLKQLELISGLSSAEARQQLLDAMQGEMAQETARRLREWEIKLKEEANGKAQGILSQAIQRSASEIVT
nr:DUF3552 domain-containing protein [Dehalococcoidia bacterium]